MQVKEKFIRNHGENDIVAYLIINLLVSYKKYKRKIILPLGPEIKDLTHNMLRDFSFEYYEKNLRSDDVYGISYKIIELN